MADKAEKVTFMILKVDLQCPSCYKKVKKIPPLQISSEIRDQVYEEKNNLVKITVVCCSPEKIRDKLCCKGGKVIKSIEIVQPRPPPPKPKEPEKPKEPDKPKEPENPKNPKSPKNRKSPKNLKGPTHRQLTKFQLGTAVSHVRKVMEEARATTGTGGPYHHHHQPQVTITTVVTGRNVTSAAVTISVRKTLQPAILCDCDR